jgi:hypothetical protein
MSVAFDEIYSDWHDDERQAMKENHEELQDLDDEEIDNMPVDRLPDCHYKNLRIVYEYFREHEQE